MKDIDDSAINFLEGQVSKNVSRNTGRPSMSAPGSWMRSGSNDACHRWRGPKPPGNHWREIVNGGIDQTDFADVPWNRPRTASAAEIRQMEIAFGWLSLLRNHDSGLAIVTINWAFTVSCGRTVRDLCRRKGWAFGTFYRKRNIALKFVADHLNAAAVPVF